MAHFFLVLSFLFFGREFLPAQRLYLKENLQRARRGDYLVIASNKTQTLMHIYDKQPNVITIEEIAVPEGRAPKRMAWKDWIQQNAPGNTSWVMYEIDLQSGQMVRYFSFTKNGWYSIPDADNFLSKLLNLSLTKIPEDERKRAGPKSSSGPDLRPLWQPRMIVDGRPINKVQFDAWRTRWPRDSSELSGRVIEIYLPQESQVYPSYFPYWLQINGAIGRAKVRIIDSGRGLHSPKPPLTAIGSS
ncbi:MAG: hypothetical protein H0V82_12460 [Candidatus Protochlamydia sp.]|nr:hypothetical protein [Candidatus Protochlamydia sp.]